MKCNNLKIILFLCVLCIQCVPLECVAANEEVTVQSKQFVSERYSSLFHRTFCRSLLSSPKRISYVECDRLHLTPCPFCISSDLNDRLKVDLKELRYEQQQREVRAENAKIKRAATLKRQHQRREDLRLRKEQEIRQREIERRKQEKDRIEREAEKVEKEHEERQLAQLLLEQRHQQHRVDVVNIKQRLKEVQVALTVKNVSGFTLPKNLFYAQTHIVGELDFPLDKQSIHYGYTIHCRDSRYAYSVFDDGEPLSYLSTNNVATPIVTVMSKQFFETEQTVIFEDINFKMALHKIKYANPLSVDITIRNKSKILRGIERMSVTIDDVPYCFALDSIISLPPKSTISHLTCAIFSPDSTITLPPKIERFSQPLIYSDLFSQHNNIRLVLSVYCKQESIDQNAPDFHQQIEVTWLDLFDQ